ncbi:MAG: hypothetical protein CVV24_11420 [Ignavibacteriae bacterium HGW-Ignavibacteriae-3]|nr:MAG: hypothetical protein CVV24_11420 [Ignavibacteriae bacterium HGW-Ignavibacteriae-3]
MKKKNIYLALFVATIMLTFIYLGGCKDSSTSEPEIQTDQISLYVGGQGYKNIAAYKKYGELHNTFLTDVKNNFVVDNSTKGKSNKLTKLVNFQKKSADKYLFSEYDKNLIKSNLEDYKKYYLKEDLINDFKENILDKMKNKNWLLKSSNLLLLPAYEQEAINNLCESSYNACQGIISISEFQATVAQMTESYDEYYSETSVTEDAGTLLGICLAITQSSIDWWQQNPDADIYDQLVKTNKTALAPWVAADALGALCGGISSYVTQRARTGGVSWTAVGGAAVAGAVAGSTGVVGKVFKWLGGLF